MTPEEREDIEQTVAELEDRINKLEEKQDAVLEVPHVVDQLIGQVRTLHDIVIQGFDSKKKFIETENGEKIKKSRTTSNALYAIQWIILPVVLALISAYAIIHGTHGGH